MSEQSYADVPFEVRADLPQAHRTVWDRISSPGTWFDAQTRVAIAAEARNVANCALCRERKAALSPFAVDGVHDSLGILPENIVEVIHRIVSDPGRLSKKWYRDCLDRGLSEEEYVEIVGVTCSTVSVDTFQHALGVARWDIPEPTGGDPSRVRPPQAKQGAAWVPWIAPEDGAETGIDQFAPEASNVRRAMSLVPDEAVGFMSLVSVQYLSGGAMQDFSNTGRALDRQQIELIAGRVSAINQCAY